MRRRKRLLGKDMKRAKGWDALRERVVHISLFSVKHKKDLFNASEPGERRVTEFQPPDRIP